MKILPFAYVVLHLFSAAVGTAILWGAIVFVFHHDHQPSPPLRLLPVLFALILFGGIYLWLRNRKGK